MKKLFVGFLFLFSNALAHAATVAADSVTFSLDRPGPALMQFEIKVDQATGRGTYDNKAEPTAPGVGARAGEVMPITVGAPVLKQLFAAVPAVVNHHCESHSKNLAQTGKKILRYTHDDAVAECTFNYSDDERVNTAANLFVALAQTLEYGGQLAYKLRFDRLGLDALTEELESAVKDGRAIELENIGTVLEAIEDDDRVLERVRRRAARLLEGAGVPTTQPAAQSTDGMGASERKSAAS